MRSVKGLSHFLSISVSSNSINKAILSLILYSPYKWPLMSSAQFQLYKGKLENGTYVVIRRVALSKKCSIQNLKAGLDLLSKLHHPNLVSLFGHCIDGDGQDDSSGLKLHLVYEYVPNGKYGTHLSGSYEIVLLFCILMKASISPNSVLVSLIP